MTNGSFTDVTIRSDTAGAVEDLLTLDTVSGAAGNGAALRFIDNSGTPGLHLALGRLSASRVNPATVRLDLAVAADPSASSSDDTPPLLSLVSGPSGLSVTTAVGSLCEVGGKLNVTGAAALNGGAKVAGTLTVTGTVNGRNIAADGTRLDQHLSNTANPHTTTAAQIGALPSAGGTISGNLAVTGATTLNGGAKVASDMSVTGTVNGRNIAADGTRLDQHLSNTANPHNITAAQIGALPSAGGTISGNLAVTGATTLNGAAMLNGRLTIEDAGVPLILRETGQAITAGGLWRMPLDGGILRFDVNTGTQGQEFGSNFRTALAMNSAGNVTIGGSLNLAGGLEVTGDITLAATKTLSSPGRMHISGEEILYLLNKGGVNVSQAWGGNGNLGVGGTLTVEGDITLAATKTLSSPGRMHISGEEILYLLNKGGVIVSRAWGGNGNLLVDGDLTVQGDINLGATKKFYSSGRMHIHGEEILYLLNKGGVIVSRAWGGNGNLLVEGDLTIAGNITLGATKTFSSPGRMHIGGNESLYLLHKVGVVVSKAWGGTGNLAIEGTLTATLKFFVIDHPLDSARKQLVHSVLEGPEVAVFYRGEARLCDGIATVALPGYFEALTREAGRTVLLTPKLVDETPVSALAASAIVEGAFVVKAIDDRNPAQVFYWEVKAVRADIEHLQVERERRS